YQAPAKHEILARNSPPREEGCERSDAGWSELPARQNAFLKAPASLTTPTARCAVTPPHEEGKIPNDATLEISVRSDRFPQPLYASVRRRRQRRTRGFGRVRMDDHVVDDAARAVGHRVIAAANCVSVTQRQRHQRNGRVIRTNDFLL